MQLPDGVVVRSKADSWLMRAIGWLLGLFGIDFMGRFWTTISPGVIWAPVGANLSRLDVYATTIRHELVHREQMLRWKRWGWWLGVFLWQVSYLLFPVPFFFAYFRWRCEREAYLVNLSEGRATVDGVVQTLWRNYGFCWPKSLMRKWFERELGGED